MCRHAGVDVIGVADAPTLEVSLGEGTSGGIDIPAFPHDLSNVVLYMQDGDGEIVKVKIDNFPDGQNGTRDVNDIDVADFLDAFSQGCP